jgi:hypothetical protein
MTSMSEAPPMAPPDFRTIPEPYEETIPAMAQRMAMTTTNSINVRPP